MTATAAGMTETRAATHVRVDARAKVTGAAPYVEDLSLPYGTAYAAILRSPHSHARIRAIDASAAEQLPGVIAVLTREHLGRLNPYISPGGPRNPRLGLARGRPFIATDRVRYDGEPVAAVAAESLALAHHAVSLIEVDYEELPSVFDPRDALKVDAPLLHEDLDSNFVGEYRWGWGNVEQGFREADHIFEDCYSFPTVFHHPMENVGGCVAEFREQVTLTAPIQHLFDARDEIAHLFSLAPEQVHIRTTFIGGGFGAKELKTEHLIALWLSRETGRPVCLMASAEDSMRTDARHQMIYQVKTGVKADGTLVAQEITLLVNEGAYARSINVTQRAISGAWGPYRVPHMRMVGRSVFTNRVPAGAFRSLGKAQVTWGYESNLDAIARRLGIDPFAFRLQNLMRRGDVIVDDASPMDTDYDDLLRRAAAAIGWDGRAQRVGADAGRPPAPGSGPLRGRGLSTTWRHGYSGPDNTQVTISVDQEGIVRIYHTGVEIGGGLYTVLARVAAEGLGISETDVHVAHPDSDMPYTAGVASSRDTVCLGMAVQDACEDLKRELRGAAANAVGGEADEWQVVDGCLWRGEQSVTFGEVVHALGRSGQIMGKGVHRTPRRDNPFNGAVPHWETSAGAAEVEVDPETGEVRLLKYATACDVGKAINPVACKGQLDGGAVMGLGNTLYEEMVYEGEQLLNADPFQYRLPIVSDIPPDFHSVMVENGDGPGPQGSKGMGQTAVSPIAPAIGNAIYDAVGARVHDLPITPEKVLRALGRLQ